MIAVRLVAGLGLSAIVACFALWRGSLSASGALGAIGVGTVTFAMGGPSWGLLLIAFFVSSSALSHYKERVKEPLADKFQKGHRRDLGQVLANAGVGTICAVAFRLTLHPLFVVAFAGALATVNADTWATELGVLGRAAPRLITTRRPVPVGTSGAVTAMGTSVAFAGALFIAVLAVIFWHLAPGEDPQLLASPVPPVAALGLALAGLLGSLFDSLLGATVQACYYCDFDQKETESAIHRCGRAARLVRGWAWLDNDWVNFISSLAGSLLAIAVYAAVA